MWMMKTKWSLVDILSCKKASRDNKIQRSGTKNEDVFAADPFIASGFGFS